ncbi:MAG: hypothetical protein WKG07_12590 [Hymenobacter sp.]
MAFLADRRWPLPPRRATRRWCWPPTARCCTPTSTPPRSGG